MAWEFVIAVVSVSILLGVLLGVKITACTRSQAGFSGDRSTEIELIREVMRFLVSMGAVSQKSKGSRKSKG